MKKSLMQVQGRVAMIAVAALCSGTARADTTGAQAEAMARHSAIQATEFVIAILGACASAYPETHDQAVNTMETLAPKLKSRPGVADQWIRSVAQCMDKQRPLTNEQCDSLESSIQSGKFDLNDPAAKSIFDSAVPMLQPCRSAN